MNTVLCICVCFLCSFIAAVQASINVTTTVPVEVTEALKNVNGSELKQMLQQLNKTRRILNGSPALASRPYMVYLKLPTTNSKYKAYSGWLCGGVIVHEEYVLTSAACIEDAKHFYIVSGTYRHHVEADRWNNLCIKNSAKKAIWKCVPRNYVFDGHENDNIRWMNNDIAIVKVEDEFDFYRRVRGCDFIPKPICYNNQSSDMEKPGTVASVAGWGSTERYNDWVNSRRQAQSDEGQELLEAPVRLISKAQCKKRWGPRYHNIIDNYMICSRDLHLDPSSNCLEKYADCRDLQYSDEEDADRRNGDNIEEGGFCENDHGGPLVYMNGNNPVAIGIISACLVKERTNKCYGPFLYTSIYKNRQLINCAIYKMTISSCNNLFRASVTHTEEEISWIDHPDGPSKNDLIIIQRRNELMNATSSLTKNNEAVTKTKAQSSNPAEVTASQTSDKSMQHEGVVLRTSV